MAKALKRTKQIIDVELSLSEEEAITLIGVLRMVGGDLYSSPRKHTAAVLDALSAQIGMHNLRGAGGSIRLPDGEVDDVVVQVY